jgi:hypothetical protein
MSPGVGDPEGLEALYMLKPSPEDYERALRRIRAAEDSGDTSAIDDAIAAAREFRADVRRKPRRA